MPIEAFYQNPYRNSSVFIKTALYDVGFGKKRHNVTVCYPSVCDNLKVDQVICKKWVIVSGAGLGAPVICVTERLSCNKVCGIVSYESIRAAYQVLDPISLGG